jgi:outer membrane protein TolC
MRAGGLYNLACLSGLLVGLSGCALAPEPLHPVEIAGLASDALTRIDFDQEPIGGAIDLYEAMARALKYNLDHRVEMVEAALRVEEAQLSRFDLLPNVVANTGFAARNNYNAATSVEVLPGNVLGSESLVNSTSAEKQIWTNDVAFGWNVLDFGLSYIRAQQASDRYLIAEEMRRKVAHRIIEDVRTAYWRAVSSDRLLAKLRKLERRIDKVRKDSSEISADRQTSPITAVTYARELIEIKRKIEEIERDLVVARTQLASLMNIPPGTNFKLVHPARSARDLSPDLNVPNLITQAMSNRPELREVWYQKRINQAELDAALLELLPGLQVFAGTNYDSNEFLFNSNWLSWSARASWNAMRVFQYPRKRAVVEAQDALLDERSLAVAMAIITQVHVSRIRFLQFRKEIQTANEYLNIQRQLVALLKDEAQAARVSEQTLLREELNALVAETRRDVAYASLQNAFANIYASIGIDPLPVEFTHSMPVHEVAASFRSMWIERGDHSSGATKSAQADLN